MSEHLNDVVMDERIPPVGGGAMPFCRLAALDRLWERGRTFLNCRYAVMAGAMSWISRAPFVAAVSNAGGFGVIAAGILDATSLGREIEDARRLTSNSFGVNLVTLSPHFNDLVEVCRDAQVTHVTLGGSLPRPVTIDRLKSAGIRVLCFAPTLGVAQKLVAFGADALILEGSEAGGHIGPVSTSVLVQEILPHIERVPVFVAGGIGRGEVIAAYLEYGAAGVQVGTRLVCAHESAAHPRFKRAFIRASARDAVASVQLDPRLPVIPVRALANDATKAFLRLQQDMVSALNAGEATRAEAQAKVEQFWAGALRRAVIDGDVETGSLMAGQSVGMVTSEQPMAEIIEELVRQAASAVNVERSLRQ